MKLHGEISSGETGVSCDTATIIIIHHWLV
jgi:hypothetical protein